MDVVCVCVLGGGRGKYYATVYMYEYLGNVRFIICI